MRIAAAGNTEVPAYFVLIQKGFSISLEGANWIASRSGLTLVGAGPLELLALSSLYEARGDQWQPTDGEIQDFLSRYPQS